MDLGKEQEANTEQQQQQSPPGEIRGPEATPGAVIISWAPTPRASLLGFWGENEGAVFGFKMRRTSVFHGLNTQVTQGRGGPLF